MNFYIIASMNDSSNLEILYRDEYLLIINKPSGLLTHRSNLSTDKDSVVDRLKLMFENPPSPVHRLDRPTSGVIVSAFNKETARIIGSCFLNGSVHKKYIAVVRGYLDESGTIDIPLKKDGEGELQGALTAYRSLKQLEIPIKNNKYSSSRYSLIQVEPVTGRFHQIRRHLARIGHPLLGDTSHGDLRHNRIFEKEFNNNRLLLHGESISFPHPESMEKLLVSAPIPLDMMRIIERFNDDDAHHEHDRDLVPHQ